MTNGHDKGPVERLLRVDHARKEDRKYVLGCACLVAILGGLILAAVVCGAGLAIWWRL